MSTFEKNITASYLRKSLDITKQLKELSYQFINLSESKRILDIGCGPGIDTVAMAKIAHADTRIVGLDFEQSMLDTAIEATEEARLLDKVNYVQASAAQMPFADESFDAVRAERLFQVISPAIASPQTLFDEAYRVLKSGGTMVLADTDWATASINFSDINLERRFVRFFSDECRPNGYAGREFLQLMNRAGMKDIQVIPIPILMREFSDKFPLADWLVRELRNKLAATEDEIEQWMTELTTKSERGEFLCVCNMNVVVGVKSNYV